MADAANPDLEPAERRAAVVDLHRQGKTFTEIGEQLGFSKQRAHQLYWEAMNGVVDQAVTAHRAALIEIMNEVIDVANQIMHKDHIAHSNGRVVMMKGDDKIERPVLDDGPKLDAGRTITNAVARMAKLVGADAPTKTELDGVQKVRYEIVGINPEELL